MSEWQPIETAPKDGTHFLGFWPKLECSEGENNPCKVRTWYEDGHRHNPFESSYTSPSPTDWMPLPPPPTDETQKGNV